MLDRRDFVRLSAGVALGGVLGGDRLALAGSGAAPGERSIEKIGVQLYTVRDLLEKDFEGTLAGVAQIGFQQVEFHRYFGRSPEEVRDLLARLGLEAPAKHYSWEEFQDDPDKIVESAGIAGHRYVLLAWMPPEARSSITQYQELAAFFNQMGKACQSAGLKFAFHNHEFEFTPIDGKVPFDVLLNETDPDLVEFEIDLFWTIQGGHDPLAYFKSHPGRFTLCHIKDRAEGGDMVDVGAGEIDFASIFAQMDLGGLQYFFVEHDEPVDPMVSIKTSFQYIEALRF